MKFKHQDLYWLVLCQYFLAVMCINQRQGHDSSSLVLSAATASGITKQLDEAGEFETEEDLEEKNIQGTTPRQPPLIINSHPILTSSSITKAAAATTNRNSIKITYSSTTSAPSTTTSPTSTTTHYSDNIGSNDDDFLSTSAPVSTYGPPILHSTPAAVMPQKQMAMTSGGSVGHSHSNGFAHHDDFTPSQGAHNGFLYQSTSSSNSGSEQYLHSLQSIKDAYFDVLEKFREFRITVSQRYEGLERRINELQYYINQTATTTTTTTPAPTPSPQESQIPGMHNKMLELERRLRINRLVDHCVHYILGNSLPEALKAWNSLESVTASNMDETNEHLREIVHLVYTRDPTNNSPVFPFLRRLNGVEKLPLYDFLINGMKSRNDFDGTEIFYIAQFLKERNLVRSAIYSKIPKAVQYAVSGRSVNVVLVDKRSGRNYVHVRDDQQNLRDRLNFYIQASQSYTSTRAAVWSVEFEPTSENFRIRNALYGDYMYINEEGFLETLPATSVTNVGTEFSFILKKNVVLIESRNYKNQPLVVIRGGGKFPFYFSLLRENPHASVAQFLVEPDTLLQ